MFEKQSREKKIESSTNLIEKAEQYSGYALHDVEVHYNSPKPQVFDAQAYTEGNDIYLTTGAEYLLSHELGHVVQQKEGKMTVTGIEHGMPVNTDKKMEEEADQFSYNMKHIPVRQEKFPELKTSNAQSTPLQFGKKKKLSKPKKLEKKGIIKKKSAEEGTEEETGDGTVGEFKLPETVCEQVNDIIQYVQNMLAELILIENEINGWKLQYDKSKKGEFPKSKQEIGNSIFVIENSVNQAFNNIKEYLDEFNSEVIVAFTTIKVGAEVNFLEEENSEYKFANEITELLEYLKSHNLDIDLILSEIDNTQCIKELAKCKKDFFTKYGEVEKSLNELPSPYAVPWFAKYVTPSFAHRHIAKDDTAADRKAFNRANGNLSKKVNGKTRTYAITGEKELPRNLVSNMKPFNWEENQSELLKEDSVNKATVFPREEAAKIVDAYEKHDFLITGVSEMDPNNYENVSLVLSNQPFSFTEMQRGQLKVHQKKQKVVLGVEGYQSKEPFKQITSTEGKIKHFSDTGYSFFYKEFRKGKTGILKDVLVEANKIFDEATSALQAERRKYDVIRQSIEKRKEKIRKNKALINMMKDYPNELEAALNNAKRHASAQALNIEEALKADPLSPLDGEAFRCNTKSGDLSSQAVERIINLQKSYIQACKLKEQMPKLIEDLNSDKKNALAEEEAVAQIEVEHQEHVVEAILALLKKTKS